MQKAWPESFPANCPPEEVSSDPIEAFRIVASDPPTIGDFRPTRVEWPHRKYRDRDEECCACGASLHLSIDAAKRTLKKFPKLGIAIAGGTVDGSAGAWKETRAPEHITWWIFDGHAPNIADFSVVTT